MRIRDQERARQAYQHVAGVTQHQQDYKIAVNSFAGFVLREGLAAAVSWVERTGDERGTQLLLGHLARIGIRGLGQVGNAQEFGTRVRNASARDYMLATRDLLKTLIWYRRAVQALFD